MGLKALGNYYASSWSNKISILLLEGPKPTNSMISGFVSPVDPYIPELLQKIWEIWKPFWKHVFTNLEFGKIKDFGTDLEKTGTKKWWRSV